MVMLPRYIDDEGNAMDMPVLSRQGAEARLQTILRDLRQRIAQASQVSANSGAWNSGYGQGDYRASAQASRQELAQRWGQLAEQEAAALAGALGIDPAQLIANEIRKGLQVEYRPAGIIRDAVQNAGPDGPVVRWQRREDGTIYDRINGQLYSPNMAPQEALDALDTGQQSQRPADAAVLPGRIAPPIMGGVVQENVQGNPTAGEIAGGIVSTFPEGRRPATPGSGILPPAPPATTPERVVPPAPDTTLRRIQMPTLPSVAGMSPTDMFMALSGAGGPQYQPRGVQSRILPPAPPEEPYAGNALGIRPPQFVNMRESRASTGAIQPPAAPNDGTQFRVMSARTGTGGTQQPLPPNEDILRDDEVVPPSTTPTPTPTPSPTPTLGSTPTTSPGTNPFGAALGGGIDILDGGTGRTRDQAAQDADRAQADAARQNAATSAALAALQAAKAKFDQEMALADRELQKAQFEFQKATNARDFAAAEHWRNIAQQWEEKKFTATQEAATADRNLQAEIAYANSRRGDAAQAVSEGRLRLDADIAYADSRRRDADQSGYLADGRSTLEREKLLADTDRANLQAQVDMAERLARIALAEGDQQEAARQFDRSQALKEEIERGTLSLNRDRFGLESELGRGRLDLERQQFELDKMRDPASFIFKAYASRGIQPPAEPSTGNALGMQPQQMATAAPMANRIQPPAMPDGGMALMQEAGRIPPPQMPPQPTMVGGGWRGPEANGVAATTGPVMEAQQMSAIQPPLMPGQQPARILPPQMPATAIQPPRMATSALDRPLTFDDVERSGNNLPGLSMAMQGKALPSYRPAGGTPLISQQGYNRLTGTEKQGLRALVQATGSDPDDYLEESKRLSQTGSAPQRFETRRIQPPKLYA